MLELMPHGECAEHQYEYACGMCYLALGMAVSKVACVVP